MSNASKKVVMGSMVVSGLVGIAAIADLIIGTPFAGSWLMDVMFLIATTIVIYIGWEVYKAQ